MLLGMAAAAAADILFLKHDSSIFRQSSDPVCGFSMMERVSLCAVWPIENWLGSSLNHIGLLSEYVAAMLKNKDVWSAVCGKGMNKRPNKLSSCRALKDI